MCKSIACYWLVVLSGRGTDWSVERVEFRDWSIDWSTFMINQSVSPLSNLQGCTSVPLLRWSPASLLCLFALFAFWSTWSFARLIDRSINRRSRSINRFSPLKPAKLHLCSPLKMVASACALSRALSACPLACCVYRLIDRLLHLFGLSNEEWYVADWSTLITFYSVPRTNSTGTCRVLCEVPK